MGSNAVCNDTERFSKGIVNPADKPALIEKLKQELLELKDDDGIPLIESVKTRDEMYPVTTVMESPDLFLVPG